MKVKPSIKIRCKFCIIKRRNTHLIIKCILRRHNQRQG